MLIFLFVNPFWLEKLTHCLGINLWESVVVIVRESHHAEVEGVVSILEPVSQGDEELMSVPDVIVERL